MHQSTLVVYMLLQICSYSYTILQSNIIYYVVSYYVCQLCILIFHLPIKYETGSYACILVFDILCYISIYLISLVSYTELVPIASLLCTSYSGIDVTKLQLLRYIMTILWIHQFVHIMILVHIFVYYLTLVLEPEIKIQFLIN